MAKRAPSWFLGVDLGTGSCKAAVVDEHARLLGLGSGEYPAGGLQAKWQEQDPDALLVGMAAAVRSALQASGNLQGNCGGMSIGGALHSLLAVDANGAPLTGVITWADGRAISESNALRQSGAARDLYRQTGCPVHGMYPLYKIRWLRENHPETFSQARRFISAKEYVVHRLTGEYIVDYSLASGTGLLDVNRMDWSEIALDLAGAKREQLSPLADPITLLPGIDAALARRMGLSPTTRLVLGSSDAANSHIGSGAAGSRQASCMIGTSGALRVMAASPVLDGAARTFCYAIDGRRWLVGGAINNGGLALNWLRDLINSAFPALPPERRLSFSDLLALAAEAPPGADGLVCLPFFAGERSPGWNPCSQAVFLGLNLGHGLPHMARALLEGIAFRMLSVQDALEELVGDLDELRSSGGYTQSPFWLQLMADVLNRRLRLLACGETSALGAAFWALIAAAALPGLDAVPPLAPLTGQVDPDPDQARFYHPAYDLYRNLYQAVGPILTQLAQWKAEL